MGDIHMTDVGVTTDHDRRTASTCRWAQPTLFLDAPFWLETDQTPWACIHDAIPRLLHTTEGCATCARWERGFARVPGSADIPAATANPTWQDWLAGYPAPHETDRS